jgi:adenine-specific DNA-methyltransferase
MPPRKRKTVPGDRRTPVDSIRHDDKRVNIPTADAQDFVDEKVREPVTLLYPRNTSLDPQLVWKGKDTQDAEELSVTAPALFIQEKIDPLVLIENLGKSRSRREDVSEPTLFETFDGLEGLDSVEFYKHAANWSNRLILGDSLEVMASLAEREALRGQVQTIYIDPPYGIKFGSNWQVTTRRRDVTDGKLEDATREVEQIKAFRDTWQLGINSYLSYLRDRLLVARDLLTQTGSVFVQISNENVHLVRCLLDEVFGRSNFVATIAWKKASPETSTIRNTFNYILWCARDIETVKVRKLYRPRRLSDGSTEDPKKLALWAEFGDGSERPLTTAEKRGETPLPPDARVFRMDKIVDQGSGDRFFELEVRGERLVPPSGFQWRGDPDEMKRLVLADRVRKTKDGVGYRLFLEDHDAVEVTNLWEDTAGKTPDMIYVVQTNTKIVQRCVLMSSDPGDLVVDPTCGAGTTAYVAEQWGRRWITVDTSRVALTLARQRLMGARFPYYVLADSPEGRSRQGVAIESTSSPTNDVRKGFLYSHVPHVTLKSIANNVNIRDGMSRDEVEASVRKHADTSPLYDQPVEDSGRVRVSGPFTVESSSPHRSLIGEVAGTRTESAGTAEPAQPSFEKMLLENLQQSGVQNGRKAERFEFSSVELLGGRYLIAEAFPTEVGPVRQRVAVSIGPRYGTVGVDWIKAAAREAHRGDGFDVLLVLGFAFDPRALEIVEEFRDQPANAAFGVEHETRVGALRILLVRMNADLAMGEGLLKKSKAANLFTVFGEPDVADPVWTDDGWQIEVRGFDVYNPITGDIRSGTADDIAMWMIDSDYNEEAFFVRHCYFPGRDDPYKRLKAALKADIDEDAWESLNSTTSRPFPHPSTGKIAIKVINDYGDEVLRVLDLPPPSS